MDWQKLQKSKSGENKTLLYLNISRLVLAKLQKLFHVDTFEEIITNTKEVHKELKGLGCFKTVDIQVDTLPDPSEELYQVISPYFPTS